jgi:hypothetical protein
MLGRTNAMSLSGGGVLINAIQVDTLPAIVVDGQFVIISALAAANFTFSYALPISPVLGDVWVHTLDNGGYAVVAGSGKSAILTLGATMQYDGSTWVYKDAYVGVSGVWQMCSTMSTLGSLSWTAINAIANSGEDITRFFAVGDQKSIILSTTTLGSSGVTVEILDFNHDYLTDGVTKVPITFGMVDCFNTTRYINQTQTTVGGWDSCELRAYLRETVWAALPTDLQAVIKNVNKRAIKGGNFNTIITSVDNLFLLSEIEVLGAITYSYAGEGTKYAKFTTSATCIKKINGTNGHWWCRSPYPSNNSSFANISNNGGAYGSNVTTQNGVACCFCI